jgi:ribonuclease R
MEIEVAIRSHGLPRHWPDSLLKQLERLPDKVPEAALQNRQDLRDLPFVTIDGEDARDFDDAVYAIPKPGGGWRLYVAIADVSHYVLPGTALDLEAQQRGNSVYFPDYVLPMLPEKLSNGLCSLNPRVNRLAMVCEMTISQKGRLSGYRFYEAMMRSAARLTYTQVAAMLDQPDSGRVAPGAQLHPLWPKLAELSRLYEALHKARTLRGAIDFDTTETRIVFSESRKIKKIEPVIRNRAHRIIEECMLCANVAAARFLSKQSLPVLYRVHNEPAGEKRLNLSRFLAELGLSLPATGKMLPSHYQELLASIQDRADCHVIQTMLLRSMQQACYSPDNHGHFGLAYPAYTHFTSPIRRYPDLLVHRAIRLLIHGRPEKSGGEKSADSSIQASHLYPYDEKTINHLGQQCSMTERRADDATRDVITWLKCEFMLGQVGESWSGVVSAVTSFGLFVELEGVYVDGLVHVSTLDDDYYHYDVGHQRLTGERSGRSFHLGDTLQVIVERVDLSDRKIDLSLDGSQQKRKTRSSGRKKTRLSREKVRSDELIKKTGKSSNIKKSKVKASKKTGRKDKKKSRKER